MSMLPDEATTVFRFCAKRAAVGRLSDTEVEVCKADVLLFNEDTEKLDEIDSVLSRTQLKLQVRAEKRVRRTTQSETASPCESQVSQLASIKNRLSCVDLQVYMLSCKLRGCTSASSVPL